MICESNSSSELSSDEELLKQQNPPIKKVNL